MSQPKGESGWPIAASAQETRAADSTRGDDPTVITPTPLSDSQAGSTSGIDHGRFAPGTVLGDRYRIVELLGRGGMGEVYRVDDLKLGQSVSLKFLTARLGNSREGLSTLYQEARSARLVGHANTCRVFDVGEIDGVPFISMEYVDGENLKSLINRIGRLPHAKAVEISQQLCRGLHAIHEQGLLHRDLKPTNVMIDGRGRARITDFGLAGAAQGLVASSERAGTPAYMAPEQLAGSGLSVRSDVYALGLILYEVFTGRRTFDGRTWAEYTRLHTESTPRAPSALVEELDPVVERVILRCLAKDPQERPVSALAVLAALPGGDPLAEAIAAGETPSPELVAAAQMPGRMAPTWVGVCGLLVVIGLGLIAWMNDRYSPLRYAALDLPPAVLQDRARDVIRSLGYTQPAADSKGAFDAARDIAHYVRDNDDRPDRWRRAVAGPTPLISYWFRQAAAPLTARGAQGVVSWDDPAPTLPGMVGVMTDTQGRLRRFYAVPPDHDSDAPAPEQEPAWDTAFRLAGLSPEQFVAEKPSWAPPVFGDVRRAWRQETVAEGAPLLHVEASAYAGRITSFAVIGPWTEGYRPDKAGPEGLQWASAVIIVALLLTGGLLTLHNLRQGRGDRRGGLIAAVYLFVLSFLSWAVLTDSVPSFAYVIEALIKGLGGPAFFAGTFWLLYMALEPYLRRRWPHRLVGWTRILTGRWRDPLVGRDILAGLVLGTAAALVVVLAQVAPLWFGRPPTDPFGMLQAVERLTPRTMVALLLTIPVIAVFNGLIFVFVPLLFYILVRVEWLAAIFTLVFWSLWIGLVNGDGGEDGWMFHILYAVLLASLWTTAALRFGLLTSTVTFMTLFLLESVSLTLDLSSWFAPSVSLAALAVLGLTAAACHVALGGRLPRLALLDA